MFVHVTHQSGWQPTYDLLSDCGFPNYLLSFAHQSNEPRWGGVWSRVAAQGISPRLILDSGAFTAFTLGKVFEVRDYARWALDFRERWSDRMVAIHAMNLDVIGDQAATWRNQRALEKLGLDPMPIVTFNAPMKDLRRALDAYSYIALGGLVPHARNRKRLGGWLDTCFREVLKHGDKAGELRRVHLLGITSEWALKRYPVYSSDSSSYIAPLRYGNDRSGGLPRVPRYTGGDAAAAASQNSLRSELVKLRTIQDEATAIWTRRGITWPEPLPKPS